MSQRVVVWWRDIPAQVTARAGRTREAEHLGERFEKAIDRAAMRARLEGSDAYLEQWRRVAEDLPADADLSAMVSERVEALRAEYDNDTLERLILNGGFTSPQPEGEDQ